MAETNTVKNDGEAISTGFTFPFDTASNGVVLAVSYFAWNLAKADSSLLSTPTSDLVSSHTSFSTRRAAPFSSSAKNRRSGHEKKRYQTWPR